MKQSLSFRSVLWTLGAFLVAAGPHLAVMPPWLSGAVIGACGWRLAAARFRWRPPHWLLRTGLTVIGVMMVIMAYGTLWGRRAATALLCVMIAAKLMEMFRLRDARMVASLGFFLVATQFLFSQKLIYLTWLVLACWLVTVALYLIQRDSTRSGRAEDAAQPVRRRRSGFVPGLVLLGAALPFALVLFVLFPRLAQPLWGVPDHVLDGRTGLSETMSPGMIASLFADDSPAFRVEFDGPVPEFEQRYWRGPVLWQFDGTTWRRLFFSGRPAERYPNPEAAPWHYRVQLEPNEQRWLFSLDYPAAWPDDATLTADYQLVRGRPVTSLISYEVTSQPNFQDSPVLFDTLRQAALQLPEERNPRTRDRARDLRAQYPDDPALIEAVLEWFNTDNFYYSLETAPLGRHGADEFLFDLKTGYCEYYASAFVILMRAAGIPARIVTGYQGGFWQRGGEYLLIRQSDAHAWAEVWLPDSGWTRVDPTAAVSPSRILQGAREAVDAPFNLLDMEWVYRLRNQYDRVQHLWNRWVLDFDAGRQQRMLQRFGLGGMGSTGHSLLLVGALLAVMAPVVWLLWQWRPAPPASSRAQRAWRRLQGRLRRVGIRARPSETPIELARRAALVLDNGSELIDLAEDFSRVHYGPPGHADEGLVGALSAWRPVRRLNRDADAPIQAL